jgi:O-antigen/teichoic acid export membrane protein
MEAKLFQHGRTEDLHVRFDRYVMRPIRIIGFAMPVLIGPAIILLPVVIALVLPDYAVGVPAMQALMLGGFFLAVSFPLRGILVAAGRQIRAAAVLLGSVLLHAALSYALILAGFGIVGVAVSAGVAFLCAGAGLLALVIGALPVRPVNLGRSVLVSLLPFPIMIGALGLARQVADAAAQPLLMDTVIQLGVYGLVIGAAGVTAMRLGAIPTPGGLSRLLRRRRPAASM